MKIACHSETLKFAGICQKSLVDNLEFSFPGANDITSEFNSLHKGPDFHDHWQDGEKIEEHPDQVIFPRIKDEPKCEEAAEQVQDDLQQVELRKDGDDAGAQEHEDELHAAHANHRACNSQERAFSTGVFIRSCRVCLADFKVDMVVPLEHEPDQEQYLEQKQDELDWQKTRRGRVCMSDSHCLFLIQIQI